MPHPSPKPSASVILLRDGAQALEVLLVRRHEAMAAHGGSWVFPGGKVEAADVQSDTIDHVDTARRTAIREVEEETGISLQQAQLQPYSHWTTSTGRPKRFANWFFVAPLATKVLVHVDGSEIVEYQWMSAEQALSARHQGEIILPPPTFVTLHLLAQVQNLAHLPSHFERHRVERFRPKIVAVSDGEIALYEGDAAYDSLTLEEPGPRHRLQMLTTVWHYERSSE